MNQQTSRDTQRTAEGYYLPYKRTVNFFVNGVYRSSGELAAKESHNVKECVDLMMRQSARKWNVPIESITVEY